MNTNQDSKDSKITVIYHRADFDGIFCREIARKFMPSANLIGWDYGDLVPEVDEDHTLYMLDICVDALMGHPNLVWIDHHKSAIEKYKPTVPGYRIDGVAACRLAWQWFNMGTDGYALNVPRTIGPYFDRKVTEPLAVRLAGEYDIWDKRDPRAEIFQFGLRSRELTKGDWDGLLELNGKVTVDEVEQLIKAGQNYGMLNPDGTSDNAMVLALLEDGKLLQTYQQGLDAHLVMAKSYVIEWEGLKFLTVNTGRFNSLTFAAKDVPETGHDALMGFCYDGRKWMVSLYHAKHRTDLDLSAIATKYGGGGHRGACGFQTAKLDFLP